MANEIQVQITLNVTNGAYSPGPWSQQGSYTQVAQGGVSGIIPCTTTKATVDVGSVTTLGYSLWKNLDANNSVEIGLDVSSTFTPFCLLKPNEQACFRSMTGVTLQVKSLVGPANLQYWLLQD